MSPDFFMVICCSILGLAAHGATTKRWLDWVLRILIGIFVVSESLYCTSIQMTGEVLSAWNRGIFYVMSSVSAIDLIRVCRKGISCVLTAVEYVAGGRFLVDLFKRRKPDLFADRIFQPDSIPHMVAFFIYVQTMSYLLLTINPADMGFPSITMPMPLPLPEFLSQLLSYNGLGLVVLSFCGVGVFVARKPRECMKRLGWEKPTGAQIGIGLLLIVGTFLYEYIWSIFASSMHQDLGAKLAMYNSGTFSVVGGFGPAVILALATAVFAGVGEETLIRGALQPAFGLVPAGILHGVLHGQFAHAPFFILQVAVWSCLLGIVRKYTNTTTTIICHAGWNFITTFLFAFNP